MLKELNDAKQNLVSLKSEQEKLSGDQRQTAEQLEVAKKNISELTAKNTELTERIQEFKMVQEELTVSKNRISELEKLVASKEIGEEELRKCNALLRDSVNQYTRLLSAEQHTTANYKLQTLATQESYNYMIADIVCDKVFAIRDRLQTPTEGLSSHLQQVLMNLMDTYHENQVITSILTQFPLWIQSKDNNFDLKTNIYTYFKSFSTLGFNVASVLPNVDDVLEGSKSLGKRRWTHVR